MRSVLQYLCIGCSGNITYGILLIFFLLIQALIYSHLLSYENVSENQQTV